MYGQIKHEVRKEKAFMPYH